MRFHPLTVTALEPTAEDAVCLTLEIPPELRESFAFRAGQYLTVRRAVGGRIEQRTYSIVTPPGASRVRLGVRAQPGGRMSQELARQVRPGDVLEVGTPLGRFHTAIDPGRARSYVAFAAGSGITPVLSLITHTLEREERSRVLLIYGNRSTARTMFREETLALKNRYLERFAVHFIMSREPQDSVLLNGRIDRAKVEALARHIPDLAAADEYLICGPAGMVEELSAALAQLNPAGEVRIERFTSAPAREAAAPVAHTGAVREPLATVDIVMDGRRRRFAMTKKDESVLSAAERAGLHLPFSCRSGICATCRAKITSGAAVMMHNIALEPWEVEAGFVLCCQARPTTSTLELSYDEK